MQQDDAVEQKRPLTARAPSAAAIADVGSRKAEFIGRIDL